MRIRYLQETVARAQAECIIGFAQVGSSRTRVSGDRSPLGMVKYIEGLCTKFEAHPLGDLEVFEESHVEVGPVCVV